MSAPRNYVPPVQCMITELVMHATGRRARRIERANTQRILNPTIARMLLAMSHNHARKEDTQP